MSDECETCGSDETIDNGEACAQCGCDRANDSRPAACSLWRNDWVERDGKMQHVKTTDLFVYACVNTNTGEVEMEVQPFDDELSQDLIDGWEWRRFRLVEANADCPDTGEAR